MFDGSTAQLSTGNDHDGSPGREETAAGLIRIPWPYGRRWVAPARSPATSLLPGGHAHHAAHGRGVGVSSELSEEGRWAGRESRGSGKGSRPRAVPPPRSSPRRFPRWRHFSGGGWRHVRLDGVRCDTPSVGVLLSDTTSTRRCGAPRIGEYPNTPPPTPTQTCSLLPFCVASSAPHPQHPSRVSRKSSHQSEGPPSNSGIIGQILLLFVPAGKFQTNM